MYLVVECKCSHVMSSEFSRGLLLRAVGHGVSVCLVQQKHAEKVYIQTDCEEEETNERHGEYLSSADIVFGFEMSSSALTKNKLITVSNMKASVCEAQAFTLYFHRCMCVCVCVCVCVRACTLHIIKTSHHSLGPPASARFFSNL